MLKDLDRVDWGRLSHAYGEASDVPGLLRALASGDAEACSQALDQLHGNIWHQGTVYEASASAVPFLVELAQERTVVDRSGILDLLRSLATGASDHELHEGPIPSPDEKTEVAFDAKVGDELGFVGATREAVAAGFGIFLQMLLEDDVDLKIMAVYLLAAFDEKRSESGPVLWARLESERDPRVRAALLLGLLELHPDAPSTEAAILARDRADVLKELMRSDREAPIVQFASSFLLTNRRVRGLIQESGAVLQETFDESLRDLADLPWFADSGFLERLNNALWKRPGARLQRLSRQLESSDYEVCSRAVDEIEEVLEREPFLAPRMVPCLLQLVEKEDVVLRSLAESLLPKLGPSGELAIGRLRLLTSRSHDGARKTANRILQKIEMTRSTPRE